MEEKQLVPAISLRDFESRRDIITKELVDACEHAGFLKLVDHGITREEIEAQFAISKAYFDLPLDVKARIPHDVKTNNGWEYKSQLRPSTNAIDQKESFWLMKNSQWPSDEEVPGFRKTTSQFMAKCERISDQVLSCLSVALGFEEDYFRKAMDVNAEDSLTQLRLLHYMASEKGAAGTWRAGTHTDIGCLTLLFQRDGEDGLEICPGRESCHSYGIGDTFTPLSAETGPIVVNIGDMLMAWSDDRLKANFHRVRANEVGPSPDRYSIAYFNTGRKNVVMQGPKKTYPAVTCGEWFLQATERQFGALSKARQEKSLLEDGKTTTAALTPVAVA